MTSQQASSSCVARSPSAKRRSLATACKRRNRCSASAMRSARIDQAPRSRTHDPRAASRRRQRARRECTHAARLVAHRREATGRRAAALCDRRRHRRPQTRAPRATGGDGASPRSECGERARSHRRRCPLSRACIAPLERGKPTPEDVGRTQYALGQFLYETGDRTRARALLAAARASLVAAGPAGADVLAELDAFVRTHR